MSRPTRRELLRAGLATGVLATGALPLTAADASARSFALATNPFTLGVASGDPRSTSVVIWSRLALRPLASDGHGGMPLRSFTVSWQVASDELFTQVVRSGTTEVSPRTGFALHVLVQGLQPGGEYFYRFKQGRHLSPVGRTLTTPTLDTFGRDLTMSFVSCAQYEHGFFTAYRRLAEDQPDLVLHLGDYQYEYRAGVYVADSGNVRDFRGPETVTLANYRQRYAQYHTDPDLQAAHAIAPWAVVFDDHEVANNWAGDVAQQPQDQQGFLKRRAAAFRAYYENMPLRPRSIPSGPGIALYRRQHWGRLATFHMLDTRQFRDDQACGDGYDACPAADAKARTMPGTRQEAWLADGFASSKARWDVLGQQVFFGRRDTTATPDNRVSMDAWDGYTASRRRVTRSWVRAGVRNPIVLTGDVHAHWASEVLSDFRDQESAVVGSEFITSSLTSGGDGYDEPTGQHPWAAHNPNLRFWTNLRGYVNATITRDSLTVDYRCLPKVSVPDQPAFTRARFVVDDQVRGMRQTLDAPLPAARAFAAAPRSDAEKIRDTLAAESH